jgi:2-hydroxy-6-oxonona-2,4-dienedioate hydrolase
MKSLFQSTDDRESMRTWYERFRSQLPEPLESRRVPTSFGETHLLLGGPSDAEPLIVLHGALASSAHALRELAPLLEHFRVYAVDVIGQSVMSADTQLDVRNDDYGQWLTEVMNQLELPRAHVVGVSWGGFVAQQLAKVSPARIGRLVLLVPAGLVPNPFSTFFKLGWPMMMYRAFPSEGRRRKLLERLLTTPDDHYWGSFLAEAFRAYRLDMRVPPLTTPEQMATLESPTLVIAADGDLSFPGAKLLERAADVFPNLAGTELVEGSRHCPPTTDEFRRWLGDRITGFLGNELSEAG